MPSINDWAARAAKKIWDEAASHQALVPPESRMASIISLHAKPLVELLRESRREHYHCDDSWYCCGMCQHPDHGLIGGEFLSSHGGEYTRAYGECTCGADEWNAKVDEVLNANR